MLDVRASAGVDVFVIDTYEYREEDLVEGWRDEYDPSLWHFESKPLIPGQPHVYRVETRTAVPEDGDGPEGQLIDVQYVRLVRGRILEVGF